MEMFYISHGHMVYTITVVLNRVKSSVGVYDIAGELSAKRVLTQNRYLRCVSE